MKYKIEQWFPNDSLDSRGEWKEVGSSSSKISALTEIFNLKKQEPGIFYRIVCVLHIQ